MAVKVSIEAVSSEPNVTNGSDEEKATGDLNGREVEIQQHKEKANEKITDFVKESIIAGYTAGGAIAAGAVAGAIVVPIVIYDASKKLIEACKEYEEAVILENEAMGLDKFGNSIDNENDRDSWDRDY